MSTQGSSNNSVSNFYYRLLRACLTNSDYNFTGGGVGKSYFDIDKLPKEEVEELVTCLTEKIEQTKKDNDDLRVTKLAFLERDAGPVGLITFRNLIALRTGLDTLIVRPRKKILINSIKGGKIQKGDKIAILNDAATDGHAIFAAAEVIWRFGGVIPYALVVFDRNQGAKENLERVDIKLLSLTTNQEAVEDNIIEPTEQEVFEVDFGGLAITR